MELVGLLAALAVVSATALTTVGSRRASRSTPTIMPTGGLAELSLTRPRALPDIAPGGQDARDIRGFDAWIDHPGYAVTPQGILAAFREAERGYPQRQCDLIDDLIENDCTLRNLFEQREQSVAGKPMVMQADGADADAELAARILGTALRRLPMITVLQHLLTVNRYGWSGAEIDWGIAVIEGQPWIVPVWIAPVPARRFRISTGASTTGLDELRLYVDPARPQGDELTAGKWITLRRSGTWVARAGLMRSGAWPAMGKRFGFRDWLIYSQRFGMPTPIVKYKEGADDEAINIAEIVVRRIGNDGGAVMPDSITLDKFDATTGGDNSKSHGGLIAHCNAEMAKLVNGGTLSNDNAGSGGASYALGEVHAAGRWDNILFDSELVHEAIRTQVGEPFMRFNNLRGGAPLLKIQVVRDLDPKTQVEIADVLTNKLGIKVSVGQLRQVLGVREPTGDDDAAPGAPKPAAPAAAPAKEAA